MDYFNRDNDYKPVYTYFGKLTMTGFPPAELFWYYSEEGNLRIDVRGSYYPFDLDGNTTLAESLHFVACNLCRCEFAARGTGLPYDESRLPGTTLQITLFHYSSVQRKQFSKAQHVEIHAEDREVYKDKTWDDLVAEGIVEVDIVFRYI